MGSGGLYEMAATIVFGTSIISLRGISPSPSVLIAAICDILTLTDIDLFTIFLLASENVDPFGRGVMSLTCNPVFERIYIGERYINPSLSKSIA